MIVQVDPPVPGRNHSGGEPAELLARWRVFLATAARPPSMKGSLGLESRPPPRWEQRSTCSGHDPRAKTLGAGQFEK
jgi:hypothetical protein